MLKTKKGQRALFDSYYQQMYIVAVRYLKVREDAEDVLCEVFVRVFKSIENFEYRGEGSLRKWIKTIVINESLRFISKYRKVEYIEEGDDGDLKFTHDMGASIDIGYILEQIDSLPEGYRLVFLMYTVDGFAHKEIAEKLNISISTSKSQLFKARGRLIEKLKKENYELLRN